MRKFSFFANGMCDFSPIIFAVFFLLPMLSTGYAGDDSMNSTLPSFLEFNRVGLFEHTFSFIRAHGESIGRFIPLTIILINLTFYLFDTLFTYKIWIGFLTIINIYLFGTFIIQFKNKHFVKLCLIILTILLQFRMYHDPILAYNGQLQFVFLFTILSLISLNCFLQKANKYAKVWLLVSVLFYVLSLLMYEICYVFFCLHLAVILFHEKKIKRFAKIASPFVSVAILFIGSLAVIRKIFPSQTVGYTVKPSLVGYLSTFFKQIYSALPLSYFSADPHKLFPSITELVNNSQDEGSLSWNLVVFIISFALSFMCLVGLARSSFISANYKLVLPIGFMFWILPALLVSAANKYQEGLVFGLGALPVYIQYFGVSLIIACLIEFLLFKLINRKLLLNTFLILLPCLIAIVASIQYSANSLVAERNAEYWLYPRLNLEIALQNVLPKYVPPQSTLLLISQNQYPYGSYFWNNNIFYYQHSGGRIKTIEWSDASLKDLGCEFVNKAECNLNNSSIYEVEIPSSFKSKNGYVILSKVEGIKQGENKLLRPVLKRLLLFSRTSETKEKESSTGNYLLKESIALNEFNHYYIHEPNTLSSNPPTEINLISISKDWSIYSFK